MRGAEGRWVSLDPKPGVRKPATTNEDLFPRTPFRDSFRVADTPGTTAGNMRA
jgi:hypothetical protein